MDDSHCDAVLSDSFFAAEVEDGLLYGRGAVDDKSLGSAHLVSFLRFRKSEAADSMSLIFLAVGG